MKLTNQHADEQAERERKIQEERENIEAEKKALFESIKKERNIKLDSVLYTGGQREEYYNMTALQFDFEFTALKHIYEKSKEREKLAAEEKAKKELEEKRIAEEKAKEEKLRLEKLEAERQEMLRPDKEKIILFASGKIDWLKNNTESQLILKSDDAINLFEKFRKDFYENLVELKKQAETL